MSRGKAIFVVVVLLLLGSAIAGYLFSPKKYQTSEHLTQAVVFWNDQEAFLFLTTSTSGRAANALQAKLATTKYGFLLTLIDPPAWFHKQDITAYHLLSSGELDSFPMPPQTASYGSWTLSDDGNLQLTPPNNSYNKLNGFHWDGQKFVPVLAQPKSASATAANSTLSADDLADDADEDDGFISKAERTKFKEAGWHYKVLPAYVGEANQATLPIELDSEAFTVTVHNFPVSVRGPAQFDPVAIGTKSLELSSDKLAQPITILWSQKGWKDLSKNEYMAQFQRFGHAVARPTRMLVWLVIVFGLLAWKFFAFGHLLFAFGGMKKKVLQNLPSSYSFPPATPAQFPLLDLEGLDRYTREFESIGFTRLMDFSLTGDKGIQPSSFCRLLVNPRYHCFGEVSQIFPRGKKPMPLKCSLVGTLQEGWSISFSNRKPMAAGSLIRRKRAIGVFMPDVGTAELFQAFLKMRDQVCMDLGVSPLTDDTVDGYTRRVQRTLVEMREALQQKNFAIGVPQTYLRKLSMVKAKPEYVWLGDYPKEAEQRRQGYAVPVGAH